MISNLILRDGFALTSKYELNKTRAVKKWVGFEYFGAKLLT